MIVAISGASGFVGTHLTKIFTEKGHEVRPLNRNLFDNDANALLQERIKGCDVIINLAGASLNHRWSRKYRRELFFSRINTTRSLVNAINALENKPQLLMSASAVGYYPTKRCFDEYSSQPGSGFLYTICNAWEKEASKVSKDVRLVNARFGVILAKKGGAFSKMIRSIRLGITTVIGSGKQYFSWIDLEDHGRALEFIIDHPSISGVVNLVSPTTTNLGSFMKTVGRYYKCKISIHIPSFILRTFMGRAAEIVTNGQCVRPTKLIESGFTFKSNTVEEFIEKL